MTDADITFALPGRWWRIPVQDEKAAAKSIHAYVENTVGKVDELAQHRAGLRRQLTEAVDEARSINGRHLYLTSEITPGVPLAINLTTYAPDLPPRLSADVGVEVAAESFASSLRDEGADSEITVWTGEGVAVVREFRIQYLTDEEGNQERSLRIDYWLFRDGTRDAALLAFVAPVIWDETYEPLIDLIDAIVSTVDWQEPGDETASGPA